MQPTGFLQGRSNRVDYWTSIAIVIAVSMGLRLLFGGYGGVIHEVVLLLVAIPRLHDIGRSGWWGVGALAIAYAIGLGLAARFGLEQYEIYAPWILGYVLLCVTLLGAWNGDPDENRFGPPPPSGLSWKR